MTRSRIASTEELKSYVGRSLGISSAHVISQEMINAFATLVHDQQWIHVDSVRAQQQSPYKSTIAHGHMLLAMLPALLDEALSVSWSSMRLNYGLDRTRFITPVLAGSTISAEFKLLEMDTINSGVRTRIQATISIPDQAKPACVADLIHIWKQE